MKMPGRYDRQEILAEIGLIGQKKLSFARILVVGAGGLGCPALQYLAGAGIGTLGIVDHDIITLSNLQRQVLYTTEDLGKPKTDVARARLLQLNPEITIHTYAEKVTENNVLDLFSNYDIIIDGTDNFATKFLINDAAVKMGKPVIYGAIQGFEGQVSIFDSKYGPCYRCLYPKPPQQTIFNCAETGVIGALPGIVGSVQAMEVIQWVVRHPSFQPLIGKLWIIDARTMETRIVRVPKQKECSVCSKLLAEIILPTDFPVCSLITELDYNDIARRNDVVLIDVRELSEYVEGHISGSQHIPFTLLQKNTNVFTSQGDGKICVLYCQKGVRSKKAAEWLLLAGFKNIFSLKGGFEAWSSHG
ncbi:MAG: hypothetical protein A3E84_03955 [Gammaproteobacteria bacterium RIFCSPHIGHO2_12_FULL_42_13]|nr:MAG: hypothetical protein A3E84_03955 [Gammaproteobacteria bacterium RIFCSPHIGHO2_12_FULL_42_13]